MSDWGKEHNPRSSLPIGLHVPIVIHQFTKLIAILTQSSLATEGFIVAKHDQDHVGLDVFQILVLGGEAPVPGTAPDRITGIAQITDGQVMLWISGVENCLQPTIMLHAIRQTTSDNADTILLLECEGGRDRLHIRKSEKDSERGNPQGE
jgi:hypothetical protein